MPGGKPHQHYLGQGLGPDAAAKAALAEFGEPQMVVAAFTRGSPARLRECRPAALDSRFA